MTISRDALLTLDVDVLFLAALENQINIDNVDKVQAKIILEGANGPTTNDADAVLQKRGVMVLPDILTNAGGVVVSYFEWVQNNESFMWDEDYINQNLEKIMNKAFGEVWALHEEKKVSFRMAAYMLALGRVVSAKKLRGVFP